MVIHSFPTHSCESSWQDQCLFWILRIMSQLTTHPQWPPCLSKDSTPRLVVLDKQAIKKYRTLLCRVRFPLDPRPLLSSLMAFSLSSIVSVMPYPCAARKQRVHRTWGRMWLTSTNSASAELSVFTFCRVEVPYSAAPPFLRGHGHTCVSLHVGVNGVRCDDQPGHNL